MTLFFLKSLAEATFPFIHIACCHRGTSDMSFSSPHKFSESDTEVNVSSSSSSSSSYFPTYSSSSQVYKIGVTWTMRHFWFYLTQRGAFLIEHEYQTTSPVQDPGSPTQVAHVCSHLPNTVLEQVLLHLIFLRCNCFCPTSASEEHHTCLCPCSCLLLFENQLLNLYQKVMTAVEDSPIPHAMIPCEE